MSCFPSKFARLANIGSVAKAKQSLEKKKRTGEIICERCYMYKFKFKIDTTLSEMSQGSITVIKLMQMKPNFMILNKV